MPWTEHFDVCKSLGAPTVHGEWTQCCRQWPRSLNSTLLTGAVLLVLFTKHRQCPIEWARTCVWWSTSPAGIPGTEHSVIGTRRLPSLPERMCCRYLVTDIRADKEFLLPLHAPWPPFSKGKTRTYSGNMQHSQFLHQAVRINN